MSAFSNPLFFPPVIGITNEQNKKQKMEKIIEIIKSSKKTDYLEVLDYIDKKKSEEYLKKITDAIQSKNVDPNKLKGDDSDREISKIKEIFDNQNFVVGYSSVGVLDFKNLVEKTKQKNKDVIIYAAPEDHFTVIRKHLNNEYHIEAEFEKKYPINVTIQ